MMMQIKWPGKEQGPEYADSCVAIMSPVMKRPHEYVCQLRADIWLNKEVNFSWSSFLSQCRYLAIGGISLSITWVTSVLRDFLWVWPPGMMKHGIAPMGTLPRRSPRPTEREKLKWGRKKKNNKTEFEEKHFIRRHLLMQSLAREMGLSVQVPQTFMPHVMVKPPNYSAKFAGCLMSACSH